MLNRYHGLMVLYVGAVFLSAGLLFTSEPMVGKLLLPLFGGAPAVWNTCMVFFQTMLLLAYAYTHWSIQKFGIKWQPWIHVVIVLLPLVTLPLVLPSIGADHNPNLQILLLLLVMIGAPFFALAATGPLLQRWFAATSHPHASQPYFLYAASNLGSFIALLGYPVLVEPHLSLSQQRLAWSVGYGLFATAIIGCGLALRRYAAPVKNAAAAQTAPKLAWRRRLWWVFLAFLPSSLMLAVTAHLTTDVAAVPLLWIIPLAVYLLSFVLVFSGDKAGWYVRRASPLAAASLFGALMLGTLPLPMPPGVTAMFYFVVFALIALVAHGRLAADRPGVNQLTSYYLWLAVGGMLGGLFNALVAPVIFNDVYELPLGFLLTVPILVSLRLLWRPRWRQLAWSVIPGLYCLALLGLFLVAPGSVLSSAAPALLGAGLAGMYFLYRYRPVAYSLAMIVLLALAIVAMVAEPELYKVRSFYGVIKVTVQPDRHILSHGITVHGNQFTDADRRTEPTSYYGRQGPLGDTFGQCRQLSPCNQIAGVGLGIGTIASYGRLGDQLTFYEIDQAVANIAQNPHYFSYIRDSSAAVHIVIGDGRLNLARSSQKYDLLILDAFSSDAIPQHLLTRQALNIYQNRLADHGLLAVHISNRYVDLEPMLSSLARHAGLVASVREDRIKGDPLRVGSTWVVISRHASDLPAAPGWRPVHESQVRAWTDDYSNIFDVFRY